MRDNRKSEQYYEDYLLDNEQRISKFEGQLKSLLPENTIGRLACRAFISDLYRDRILALYSSGASIPQIKDVYVSHMEHFASSIDETLGYFDLIESIALAVLLDMNDFAPTLESILIRSGLRDYLTDSLVNWMDKTWEVQTNNVSCTWFMEFIKCDDSKKSIYLQNYLREKWYKDHREAAWYDNHKSSADTYVGYWSFEVAAVAKVFGVQDNPTWKYYPYDLVHTDI